jgi:hypothetical protein
MVIYFLKGRCDGDFPSLYWAGSAIATAERVCAGSLPGA